MGLVHSPMDARGRAGIYGHCREFSCARGCGPFVVSRLVSWFAVAALVGSTLGCASEDETDPSSASDDATAATLTAGTYALDGAPQHWVIKQLVLGADGRYTVQMYPGNAFPMDAVKTTTGTYTQDAGTLTLRFEKGNAFNSWSVKKRGKKLQLTDTHYADKVFTLTRVSDSTVFDPGPPLGTDPGSPSRSAGSAAITCHSGTGDVWINAVLSPEGHGAMYLSSTTSLQLDGVDRVTLEPELPEQDQDDWIRVVGDGQVGSEPNRYSVSMPRTLVEDGGRNVAVSFFIGSAVYESDPYVSWGFTCESTGTN